MLAWLYRFAVVRVVLPIRVAVPSLEMLVTCLMR